MSLYQVNVSWTGPSAPLYSSFHFDVAFGSTPQQTADAVADFLTALDDNLNSAFAWSVDGEVRQMNEATGALQAVIPVTGAGATCGSGGIYVDLLQGLITWGTGEIVNGRVLRGRMFIPGIEEGRNNTSGRPESTFITACETAAAGLIADADTQLVVWHRPVNGLGGEIGEVLSASMADRWSFLSSRRLG